MNAEQQATPSYAICELDEIQNRRAKGFSLLRQAEDGTQRAWHIVLVRWGQQVFGYINQCPHQGVHLDWERNQFLDPNGLRLMCGKHGSLFEIGTGRCTDGPCQGQNLEPVAVSVIDGEICVSGVQLVEDQDLPEDAAAISDEAGA